jgi:hypothetical protein
MRSFLLALLALTITQVPSGRAATHTQSIEVSPGASLVFRFRGGDVRIRRGTDPQHIIVRYTPDPKKPGEENKVQVQSRVRGSQVQIEVKAPTSLSVDAEVEVPSPIALEVHMTAGDLSVQGIDGSKDLHLFAGDLRVDVARLQDLGDAEVSVGIGDVSVPPVGKTHGWLGHTWKYKGGGPYRLYAHTRFGDTSLSVHEPPSAQLSPRN